ncbi:ribonuclease H-like domain-containing protein [Tanacetum coccineum]
MVSATCEVIWVLKILKDLDLDGLVPVTLFCDNKSAIEIAANPVMYEKTKHFDIDVHLVKEKVCYTPTVAETRDATIPFIAQDTRSYTL